MTTHNAIKYAGLLQRAAGIAAGMAGEEAGLERLGETLSPNIDLWSQPEWAFLRGERLGAVRRNVPLVAAQIAAVALCNPLTNKTLIVKVLAASALSSAGAQLSLNMLTDAAAAGVMSASQQGFLRDRRGYPGGVAQTLIRYGNYDPALPPTQQEIEVQQKAALDTAPLFAFPIILPPGQAVSIASSIVAQAIYVNWVWTERVMLPGEQARG